MITLALNLLRLLFARRPARPTHLRVVQPPTESDCDCEVCSLARVTG